MSTSPKNGKKTRCKLASPSCHDRAEAFVGPQAAVRPRFSEVPSERDKRAFEMQARRMTQREIAKKLGCSQSTVHRAILKYRSWFGSTLPEDRGEITGFARFRIALEEHRLFLLHQHELAMQEWGTSRRTTVNTKTTKVYPEGRKSGGPPVKEEVTQEQVKQHAARVSHFNAATRLSQELLMLEAGHIGVHRMTCDLAMDPDERDRWGRERTTSEATIAKLNETIAGLTQKLAELEARLAANQSGRSTGVALADEPTANSARPNYFPSARQPVLSAEAPSESALAVKGRTSSCGNLTATRPLTASGTPSVDESRTPQTTPVVNQKSPDSQFASPIQKSPSGNMPDSPPPAIAKAESGESRAKSGPPSTSTPTKSWRSMDPELAVRLAQINRLNNRN